MLKQLKKIKNVTQLPFLAFIFAFLIGGVIIALTDSEVMSNLNSPRKFITSFLAKIGNSF